MTGGEYMIEQFLSKAFAALVMITVAIVVFLALAAYIQEYVIIYMIYEY